MVRPEYVRFAEDRVKAYDFTLSGASCMANTRWALASSTSLKPRAGMVTVEKLREDRLSAREGDTIAIGFNGDVTHFHRGCRHEHT